MQAYMGIAHVAVDLRLGDQGCHRVYNNDVNGAGPDHGLGDLQSLLTAVRLGNIEIVNIHADIFGIDRIQRVLGVNKAGDAAPFLHFRDHMQGHGRLTGGFRSVDLNDPASWNAAQSQSDIQAQGTGGRCFHFHHGRGISQFHHRAFAVLFLYLRDRRVKRFKLLVMIHCHNCILLFRTCFQNIRSYAV